MQISKKPMKRMVPEQVFVESKLRVLRIKRKKSNFIR